MALLEKVGVLTTGAYLVSTGYLLHVILVTMIVVIVTLGSHWQLWILMHLAREDSVSLRIPSVFVLAPPQSSSSYFGDARIAILSCQCAFVSSSWRLTVGCEQLSAVYFLELSNYGLIRFDLDSLFWISRGSFRGVGNLFHRRGMLYYNKVYLVPLESRLLDSSVWPPHVLHFHHQCAFPWEESVQRDHLIFYIVGSSCYAITELLCLFLFDPRSRYITWATVWETTTLWAQLLSVFSVSLTSVVIPEASLFSIY